MKQRPVRQRPVHHQTLRHKLLGWELPGISGVEIKLGLRLIRKQPILAAISILALGLGIAIATTGFSMMDSILHGKLPFVDGERYVRFQVRTVPEAARTTLDLDTYQLLQRRSGSFEHLGAMKAGLRNIQHPNGEVDSVQGASITPSSFRHLPYTPILGRTLLASDGVADAPPVVLLRESLWHRRYSADPAILGQTLNIHGAARTVVGILPNSATFPADGELWLPLDDQSLDDRPVSGSGSGTKPRRTLASNNMASGVQTYAILRQNVDLATADAEVQRLANQLRAELPAEVESRLWLTAYVEPPEQAVMMATMMNLVLIAVLAVIASNVANLILTRTAYRRGELAVRTALGAGRARLISQLTVEMALLGVLAMGLGLGAAHVAVSYLDRMLTELPFWAEIAISSRTLGFVVGITALIILFSGVLPAMKATGKNPLSTLNASGRGGSFRLSKFSAAMMVIEMALSVAMLSGSLVLARGFSAHAEKDFGLPRDSVLTAQVRIPADLTDATTAFGRVPVDTASVDTAAVDTAAVDSVPIDTTAGGSPVTGQPSIVHRVAAALDTIPGIVASSLTTSLPRQDASEAMVQVDESVSEPRPAPIARVMPGFFASVAADATLGRLIEPLDLEADAPAVAVVNQPFVTKFLSDRHPIGRRLRLVDPEDPQAEPRWHEIVGVVPDLGLSAADPKRAAGLYLPMTSPPPWLYLTIRGHGDPARLAGPMRVAIANVHPEIQLHRVQPLENVNWDEREFMVTFSQTMIGMGVVTLVLSLLGIYAMISFAVTHRTREIGIRVALGATHRQVLATVTAGAALYLALGGILGSLSATGYIRLQDAMLVTRLPTGEPWVLPTVVALLAGAGLLACWLPARRALRILPMEALRFG